jgi:beta-lactamase regulating signal transducer with metallopeptidase domain
MIVGLLDHLWQSTLFAGGAGLLTLCLRKSPARLRFQLWFAASVKFLVPFAALSALGKSLSRLFPATVPRLVLELRPAAEGLSAPARALAAHQHAGGVHIMPLLSLLWLAGFLVVLGLRLARWFRLSRVMRQARDLDIAVPVDVKASRTLLEPGLVGILRPMVLLPEGLLPRLTRAERDAILAHELSHFTRGDNITAATHMLVEALFWFWPPVWLIGARLIAERERACDESVLAEGHDAEVYARGILKVCRFCVQSPLACAAGASGADLGERVRQIMSGQMVAHPGHLQKAMLAAALALALALPVANGFVSAPPLMREMRQQVQAVKRQVAARLVLATQQARLQIADASPAPARVRHRHRMTALLYQQPSTQKQSAPASDTPPTPSAPPPQTSVAAAAPVPVPPSVPTATSAPPARVAVKEALVALYPEGDGNPEGITCRVPEPLPGSRLPGPKICQTNRQWAALRARHEDITPDGESITLPDGSMRHASNAVLNCSRERLTGSGIFSMIGLPVDVCF